MISLLDKPEPMERGKWSIWQWLVEPSGEIQGREARRQARLLSALLVILTPLLLIGSITSIMNITPETRVIPTYVMGATTVILILAYVVSRTRWYNLAAGLTLGAFSLLPFAVAAIEVIYAEAELGTIFIWVALPILLSSIFLSLLGTAIVTVANILALVLFVVIVPEAGFGQVGSQLGFIIAISGSILLAIRNRDVLEGFRRDELVESNRELQAIRESLEQRVAERTQALERRARYLEAAATVAQDAEAILEPQRLLSRVAGLISHQFGFYHAGIFLLDEMGRYAVLRATSSEGGQRMLEREHRLPVGGESIVGYVTARGVYRIALDVGEDATYFQNPDLPETRSEIALPLRARGEVIGALDVQSTEPEAFGAEDVAVLQIMADQVAMSISNARLFEQVQQSLEAERRAYGEVGRQAWTELLRARSVQGYRYDEGSVTPLSGDDVVTDGAVTDGAVASADGLPELVLPVRAHETTIGRITVHKPADAGDWTADEAAALETLAEQLGIALEGAQLYQETQRRAARERVIREVSDQIQQATSMESLMRVTTEELNRAMGGLRAYMRLGTGDVPSLLEE
jgi:GAF domain-containing protein